MSDQQKGKTWKTRITILDTDIEFEGRSRRTGNEFTIYNVTALDEAGLPIELRLRTFDAELPKNELIEVEIEERKDERHGDTYNISIPGKRSGGGGGGGGGLKESVDQLRNRVDTLEQQVAALMRGEKPELQSLATPPPGAAAPPTF